MKLEWVIPDFEQAFGTSSLCHNLCKGTFTQTESGKKYLSTECCHVEGLRSFYDFFLSFHFEPLISVQAWNNLHRVFGRWLLLCRKVRPGHIRLICGAHSSGRLRKGWELMDQALGGGVRLRFGSCYSHFRQNLLKGGGIKSVYFSLQMCVSLAVFRGNRSHLFWSGLKITPLHFSVLWDLQIVQWLNKIIYWLVRKCRFLSIKFTLLSCLYNEEVGETQESVGFLDM